MVRGRSLKRKSAQTSRPRRRVVPRRKASAEQNRTELRLGRDVAFLVPNEKSDSYRYRFSLLVTGNVLPSQVVSNSVLSAQKGLTAVFGMGTGVSPSPLSPVSLNVFFAHSQLHSIFSLARHSLVM